MKKLLEFILPHWKKISMVLLLDALATLSALLMPYVMSEIVESGIGEGNLDIVWKYSAVMALLAIFSLLTGVDTVKLNSSITSAFTSNLLRATFKKINSLSYKDYSKIGPSGLLTRATDDIWNVEGAVTGLPNTFVTVPIMFIGASVFSFMADSTISLIFMISIPLVLAIVLIFMRPLYKLWDKSDKYVDIQNKIVRERLKGIRVVRAFNNEEKEHLKARDATEKMSKYMITANTMGGMVDPIAMLLMNLATVAVIYFSGYKAQIGSGPSAGDIIAVLQYIAMISNALISLSWTMAWLPRLRVAVKRINEIHLLENESDGEEEKLDKTNGFDLEIKNLTFAYPNSQSPVIENVSISVDEGESVAIIGGTGSGKSTLLRLLLNLFSPSEGSITIGGTEYSNLKSTFIRSKFSVALQKAMIFEGSVRNNVKMGNPTTDEEKIEKALELSKMSDFILSHPERMDYMLVGMGQNISGGQKQRISMARTVCKEADIYVFDDSFSALDFLTESNIRENYNNALSGKSKIFITQRVSTAMSADRIYVMDGGKIVGEGTHEDLLSNCKIYKEIAYSQLGEKIGGNENA